MIDNKLQGMTGDVFNLDGRVAGSIPPSCKPNAISFVITSVMPETGLFPAWADMAVDGTIAVRINPDLCKPPYFRLFDCVAMVRQRVDDLRALKAGEKVVVPFGGQRIAFWVESLQGSFGKLNVILVDTPERIQEWTSQNLLVKDGQSRHGGKIRRIGK